MRRRIVLTTDDNRGYLLRAWPVVFCLLLVLGSLTYFILQRSKNSPSTLFTASDLRELRSEAAARPDDLEAQMNAVFAYAALISQFGNLDKAAKATLELGRGEPGFETKPSVIEAKAKLRQEIEKYRAKVGIYSEQEFQNLLRDGLDLATQILKTPNLDSSQKSALHLARGRIQLQADNPKAALAEAVAAQKLGGDPVPVHLLMADANTDLERYSESIKHLRAASLALSNWAHQEPGWEVRLTWAMMRPGRRWSREKRWKERRGEIAGNIRSVIAGEVQVLNGLEMLKEKTRGSPSTP